MNHQKEVKLEVLNNIMTDMVQINSDQAEELHEEIGSFLPTITIDETKTMMKHFFCKTTLELTDTS